LRTLGAGQLEEDEQERLEMFAPCSGEKEVCWFTGAWEHGSMGVSYHFMMAERG
jgi:hypothetical protein